MSLGILILAAAAKCNLNEPTRMVAVQTGAGKYLELDVDRNNQAREALSERNKSGEVKAIDAASIQIR